MTEHHGTGVAGPIPHRRAEALARHLFADLPRADQRRWASAYLAGLMETPGKKSVRNMGWTVCSSDTAWQSLHQVVNASTWRWEPVRSRLARWCAQQSPVRALIARPLLIPKRGQFSAGVHRRFDPATGRTMGCQWAWGLFLASDRGTVPVDWRLHLPGRWSEDAGLRKRTGIPGVARALTERDLVLDLLDDRTPRALPAAPLLVDASASSADAGGLIAGLARLGRDFAVCVPASTPLSFLRHPSGRRGPTVLHSGPVTAGRLAGRRREGFASPLARAAASRIVPGPVQVPDSSVPLQLLATADPTSGARRLWLVSAEGGQNPGQAAALPGLFASHTVLPAPLADCGIYDFEGRSFPGWHRHMTLVSAAGAHRVLAGRGEGVRQQALSAAA